jgi:hypothetical protein
MSHIDTDESIIIKQKLYCSRFLGGIYFMRYKTMLIIRNFVNMLLTVLFYFN